MPQTDDFDSIREPGPDRRDNVASAGLDPDTWVELEQWRAERGLSRSEGTRRLLRAGIDAQTDDSLTARLSLGLGLALLTAGSAALAANGQYRIALYLAAALGLATVFEPQIVTARELLVDRIRR